MGEEGRKCREGENAIFLLVRVIANSGQARQFLQLASRFEKQARKERVLITNCHILIK